MNSICLQGDNKHDACYAGVDQDGDAWIEKSDSEGPDIFLSPRQMDELVAFWMVNKCSNPSPSEITKPTNG